MKLTLIFISINVLIFILQSLGLVSGNFAFVSASFMEKPYTLLTSMFMHGSLHHLMLNMLGLFTFGSIVEHELGRKKWLILYFFAGFLGSLGYMLIGGSPFIPALGASGAIFGLIGGAAILKPKLIIWTPYGPLPMLFAAFLWGSAEFIGLFGIDTVAQSAHIFGILGGVIVALCFLKGMKNKHVAFLILLPFVFMLIFSIYVPKEINSYNPVLDECYSLNDSLKEFNIKMEQYSCNKKNLITITRPSNKKFNLAEYNKTLPDITEKTYNSVFGKKEEIKTQSIDLKEETAIITGNMGKYNYTTSAKICKNIEVFLIEFTNEKPIQRTINCTLLW